MRLMVLATAATATTIPQINLDPPLVRLGLLAQPHLPTKLFDRRLNLLDMPWTVVPLPYDDMQYRLMLILHFLEALPQDALGFVHELPVEIDLVAPDPVRRVVLEQNIVRGLLVRVAHAFVIPLVVALACLLAQFVIVPLYGRVVGVGGMSESFGRVRSASVMSRETKQLFAHRSRLVESRRGLGVVRSRPPRPWRWDGSCCFYLYIHITETPKRTKAIPNND